MSRLRVGDLGDSTHSGLEVELPVQKRLCPIFVKNIGSPDIHENSAG